MLADKGIFYNNKNDIVNILLNITKKDIEAKDWNAYRDYTPEKVIKKFKEVYLK